MYDSKKHEYEDELTMSIITCFTPRLSGKEYYFIFDAIFNFAYAAFLFQMMRVFVFFQKKIVLPVFCTFIKKSVPPAFVFLKKNVLPVFCIFFYKNNCSARF